MSEILLILTCQLTIRQLASWLTICGGRKIFNEMNVEQMFLGNLGVSLTLKNTQLYSKQIIIHF